ncbi:hypothetical protein [Flavobacterium frigoris]|uniref:hypothetical protein n=1 Tax=Flavobacterium frigoris TaxID=229204 RepID=UPI00058FA64C|nr:hypothetical protein [Flavobacterium frigoris]
MQSDLYRSKYKIIAKKLKIVWSFTNIVLLLWSFSAKAQQRYQTREGSIQVIGSHGDSIIIANSNYLFVLINYETAEIEVNPAILRNSTDSLKVKLSNSKLSW